jgi:hypothetical protein
MMRLLGPWTWALILRSEDGKRSVMVGGFCAKFRGEWEASCMREAVDDEDWLLASRLLEGHLHATGGYLVMVLMVQTSVLCIRTWVTRDQNVIECMADWHTERIQTLALSLL